MRRTWFAAASLVLAAACSSGGGTPLSGGSTGPGASNPSGSTSPTAHASGGTQSPGPGRSSGGTPKPGKTGAPTRRASADGASAALDRTCARRGIDQQGLSVVIRPGGTIGYATTYSDGSDEVSGHYSSGYGYGVDGTYPQGDARDGRFRATWTVPANAPTGLAVVTVTTQQGNIRVSFNILAKTGHC